MSEWHKAISWLLSEDTGISSKTILSRMMNIPMRAWRRGYPLDPSDFGRCERLLDKFPAWRARLSEMSDEGPVWKALVESWDAIRATMQDEVGTDWSKGKNAPKTYDLMQSIIEAAQSNA